MIRSIDRRLIRLAVVGAIAVVALAGCGRKGALDPPPSSSISSNNPPPGQPPSLGEQPGPFGTSEAPPPAPPPSSANAARPGEKKTFILDPLIR